jgi:hypothetical protein
MDPERLLPCSQEPFTGPHPEPDWSSPYQHTLYYKQEMDLLDLIFFTTITMKNTNV